MIDTKALRQKILDMAIRGKLVPQDPNDEPASVLLERIRAEKQRLIKEGKIKKDKNDSVIFKGDDNRYYEKMGSEVKDITDDLPFEIPDSWVWTGLGKLITIISGVSYDKKDVSNKGIRILRGGNVNELKISIFPDDVFLPEKYYDADKQVRKNDVVIVASTGSKAVIGKAGFVDNDIFNTQIGAFLRIVRPLFDVIAPYLKLIFATEYYREHIRMQSQGTNINNVKAEYITDLRIPFPPLAEQVRIVAEIEKFEPLIAEYDKLEQQARKLDEEIYDKLKKSILQYAIQGKLVPQEPNDEPASVLLERIRAEKKAKLGKKYVDSYIYKGDDNCYYEHIVGRAQDELVEVPFDIPDTWEWCRLKTILNLLTDGTHSTPKYTTNGIPFISVKDLSSGKISFDNTKFISQAEHLELSKRCHPCKGDILITKVGTTGIPVLVDTDKEFSLFVSVALLKFNYALINTEYLLYLLKSSLVQLQAAENTRGVGNKNWVLSDIEKTLVFHLFQNKNALWQKSTRYSQCCEIRSPRKSEGIVLPCDNLIYNFLLLAGCLAQVYARRFNAFMPHKVGKQGNVVIFFKEVLCKTMAKRMRINHFRI